MNMAEYKKQSSIQNQLGRYVTFCKNIEPSATMHDLKTRLDSVIELYDEFKVLQNEIEAKCGEDMIDIQFTHRGQMVDYYHFCVAKLKEAIEERAAIKEQKQRQQQNGQGHQSNSNESDVKLPRLTIPQFYGDYKEWPAFKDFFVSVIHDSKKLKDVEKFRYLKDNVFGEAENVIKSLHATGDNYAVAWNLITKRFEHKRFIVDAHLNEFFSLQPILCEDSNAIKCLVDKSTETVRSLQVLGLPVNQWDSILVYVLASKLDQETHKQWELTLKRDELPTFELLCQFLENRWQSLEMITKSKAESFNGNHQAIIQSQARSENNQATNIQTQARSQSQANQSQSTSIQCHATDIQYQANRIQANENHQTMQSQASQNQTRNQNHQTVQSQAYRNYKANENHQTVTMHQAKSSSCGFCNKQRHSIGLCTEFISLSYDSKMNSIKSKNLCFNCLRPNHNTSDCKNPSRCQQCNKKHHTLIHKAYSTTNLNVQASPYQSNTPQSNTQQSNQVSQVSQNINSNTISMSRTTLHATAIVNVVTTEGKVIIARALIDDGSNGSLIKTQLAKQLGILQAPQKIPIKGVGGVIVQENTSIVKFTVSSRVDPTFKIEVEAYTINKVSADLPATRINRKNWPHLNGLKLADEFYDKSSSIDILLGLDVYEEIILDGIIRKIDNSPTAMNSRLGWLMFGKVEAQDVMPQLNSLHTMLQNKNMNDNTPASTHHGGLWEAGVKSIKYHLKRVVGDYTFTFEEMCTILCQIEACLNSRPLCSISDDLNDLNYLTPAHFIIGEATNTIPEPSLLEVNVNRLKRWKLVQQTYQQFWQHWSKDYLSKLQQRPKWEQQQPEVKVGQLVLYREDNMPPTKWPLARILEIHPGKDNHARVITIKTACGKIFKRPISKVSVLPIE